MCCMSAAVMFLPSYILHLQITGYSANAHDGNLKVFFRLKVFPCDMIYLALALMTVFYISWLSFKADLPMINKRLLYVLTVANKIQIINCTLSNTAETSSLFSMWLNQYVWFILFFLYTFFVLFVWLFSNNIQRLDFSKQDWYRNYSGPLSFFALYYTLYLLNISFIIHLM